MTGGSRGGDGPRAPLPATSSTFPKLQYGPRVASVRVTMATCCAKRAASAAVACGSNPLRARLRPMYRVASHLCIVVFLTLVTQLGGLAWAAVLFFRRRLLAFVLAYVALWGGALLLAPLGGRVPLACTAEGPLQVQSWFYCITNRTYVSPDLREALQTVSERMAQAYPGSTVLVLDASFPFWDGFPLLPHLSHDDGEKVDLAFFYQEGAQPLGAVTRSPIGYFAFEPGPSDCPKVWPTLRWDLAWLQPLWPAWDLDEARTAHLIALLAEAEPVPRSL